jgi:hypothetical protein
MLFIECMRRRCGTELLCCFGCFAREIPFGFAQGKLSASWRKHARSG